MLTAEQLSQLQSLLGAFPVASLDGSELSASDRVLSLMDPDSHAGSREIPSNVRAFPLAVSAAMGEGAIDAVYAAALSGDI